MKSCRHIWLVVTLSFLTIIIGIAFWLSNIKIISPDIFWSVFVASLISFVSSVMLQKWINDLEKFNQIKEKKERRSEVHDLINKEIEHNKKILDTLDEQLSNIKDMKEDDLVKIERLFLFNYFDTSMKKALWSEIGSLVPRFDNLEKINSLYQDFEYCNNALELTSEFIVRQLSFGSVNSRFKGSILSSPWQESLNKMVQELKKKCP